VRGRTAVLGVVIDIQLLGLHLREHDYNVISQHRDGTWVPVYYVDAGVSDYFGILQVRGRR
jgi:hypothetical protein